MPNAEVNGAGYAYKIHQQDASLRCLLMLHGFMGDGRVFDHLIEGLKKSCNPVTVDLLGHGKSEPIENSNRYQAEHQTADIAALIHYLDVSPVFIYGYSMGGRLGLRTALRFPELCEGMILESTNDGIEHEASRTERKKVDAERAQHILDDFESFLAAWETLDLFSHSANDNAKLEKKYKDIQQSQNPSSLAASLRGFSNANMESVRSQLADFNTPALLLVGKEDEKYVKINDTIAQHFANAQLKELNGGHRVHLDNPKQLIKHITQFIEQNS